MKSLFVLVALLGTALTAAHNHDKLINHAIDHNRKVRVLAKSIHPFDYFHQMHLEYDSLTESIVFIISTYLPIIFGKRQEKL